MKGRAKAIWPKVKSMLDEVEVKTPIEHKPHVMTKRSTKSSDTNIDRAETSKFWHRYQMQYGFGKKPVSDDFLNELAKRLIEWCRQENALSFNRFCEVEGIARSTYNEWIKRDTKLKDAHEFAKMCIANRMMDGAIFLNRGMRENAVSMLLPQYSAEYKEVMEWRASLKTPEVAESSKSITIEMNAFPRSDLVPEKVKEE